MHRPVRMPRLGIALASAVLTTGLVLAAQPYTYNLDFSTYLGGSGGELLRDMTVDAQGNI